MRQSYAERPDETSLEVLNEIAGGACVIHFCEDITEVEHTETDAEGETETVKQYEVDEYTLETKYREGLLEAVKANREVWLKAAKESETAAKNTTLNERVKSLESMTEDLALAILGM